MITKYLHEFWLFVSCVDGLIVRAGTRHDLTPVNGKRCENERAIGFDRVSAMLPLQDSRRARRLLGCILV